VVPGWEVHVLAGSWVVPVWHAYSGFVRASFVPPGAVPISHLIPATESAGIFSQHPNGVGFGRGSGYLPIAEMPKFGLTGTAKCALVNESRFHLKFTRL